MGEWVAEVAASGNLVVLRTPPGCAHVVASALDRSGLDGLLGTVAGDDTLLCVADRTPAARRAARRRASRDLAGIEWRRWPTADAHGAPAARRSGTAASKGGPAEALMAFTASLPFDRRLWPDDIAGSRAHVARPCATSG